VTVASLLAELRSRDIRVWLDGDQLRCNAPTGLLTADLRDALRQRKVDVIEFLRSAASFARQQRAIVPLQPRGSHVPVFAVPGHNGDVFLYRALARQLGGEQPFFGLQLPGLDDDREPLTSVEDLAAYFAGQIRGFRSRGPYALVGYCAGATIAYEIAQQLVQQGEEISFIVMFAGSYPPSYRVLPQLWERYALRLRRARRRLAAMATQSLGDSWKFIVERLRAVAEGRRAAPDPILDLRAQLMRITAAAVAQYKPRAFEGRVCLFFPSGGSLPNESMLSWRGVASQIEEYYGPDRCEGDVMLLEPHVSAIAEVFRLCRDRKVIEPNHATH